MKPGNRLRLGANSRGEMPEDEAGQIFQILCPPWRWAFFVEYYRKDDII
jgi:hypothetical protein